MSSRRTTAQEQPPRGPGVPSRTAATLRGTLTMLAAPQGFTLSIAGTLAATIGQRGVPGLLPVWLFVVGSSAGFCLLALAVGAASRARAELAAGGLSGRAVLNAAPLAVVPFAVGGSSWIPNALGAYVAAGALATTSYVVILASMTRVGVAEEASETTDRQLVPGSRRAAGRGRGRRRRGSSRRGS